MKRRVFYSFHYKPDNWRTSQVRNIGAIEGSKTASDNDWEKVTGGGDSAIKDWIAKQMNNRTCTVVLVGSGTAKRKWIDYEIKKSWKDGMGVVGIRIHGLKDSEGKTSSKGADPFSHLSAIPAKVKCYDPKGADSKAKYADIEKNIADWVEEAIKLRGEYE